MSFKVECSFCDDFEEEYEVRDEAREAGREHLLEEHDSELRENYPGSRDRCQQGCGHKIDENLICKGPERHDNINWYAGIYASIGMVEEVKEG